MGEIWFKGFMCLAAIPVIVWESRASTSKSSKLSRICLILVTVVSVLAYFNFGRFHGSNYNRGWAGFQYRFVHQWEQFHYFLNAKYFKELRYDGLYVASIAAQQQSDPHLSTQEYIRDMRSNEIVPVAQLDALTHQVMERFTPERWSSFVLDNHFFVTNNNRNYLRLVRSDHGFNGSPTWATLALVFCSTLPANLNALFFLATLDIVFLALMFFAIYWAYGWRALCWTLILFGLSYSSRYYWNGGAFLRLDWLVASVIGLCMLKKQNYLRAGLLFGFAIMSRLFPLFFLIGPGILFFKDMVLHRSINWFVRLSMGIVISIALGFILGSIAGGGLKIWKEYVADIQKHRHTWLTNNVGLENILIYDSYTYRQDYVNWNLPEPWQPWQIYMDKNQEEQRIPIILVTVIFLMLFAKVTWQSNLDEAAVTSIVPIFALTLLTCYYWVMIILVGLKKGILGIVLVLILNALLFLVHILNDPIFEIIYGFMSWGLAVFFVLWLGYDFLARNRQAIRNTVQY